MTGHMGNYSNLKHYDWHTLLRTWPVLNKKTGGYYGFSIKNIW